MLHNISAAGLNEENAKKAMRIKEILDGLREPIGDSKSNASAARGNGGLDPNTAL